MQHGDLVEIDDRFELVGYGDDGVLGELLADDALNQGVCGVIDTRRKGSVS